LQANSDVDTIEAVAAPAAVTVAQRHISIALVVFSLILPVGPTVASGVVALLGGRALIVVRRVVVFVVATASCMVCS
jgi:hypothetical protein